MEDLFVRSENEEFFITFEAPSPRGGDLEIYIERVKDHLDEGKLIPELPVERFTEIYILDKNGVSDPEKCPCNFTINECGTVIVGVVNREPEGVDHTLDTGLADVEEDHENTELLGEISDDYNFTLPSNNTSRFTQIQVNNGEKLNHSVNFSFEQSRKELFRSSFFLVRELDIYQDTVHLWTEEQPVEG